MREGGDTPHPPPPFVKEKRKPLDSLLCSRQANISAAEGRLRKDQDESTQRIEKETGNLILTKDALGESGGYIVADAGRKSFRPGGEVNGGKGPTCLKRGGGEEGLPQRTAP